MIERTAWDVGSLGEALAKAVVCSYLRDPYHGDVVGRFVTHVCVE